MGFSWNVYGADIDLRVVEVGDELVSTDGRRHYDYLQSLVLQSLALPNSVLDEGEEEIDVLIVLVCFVDDNCMVPHELWVLVRFRDKQSIGGVPARLSDKSVIVRWHSRDMIYRSLVFSEALLSPRTAYPTSAPSSHPAS